MKSGVCTNKIEVSICKSNFFLINFTSWKGDLFYKISDSVTKMTFIEHGRIFKIFFVLNELMANETLSQKFHPYSILTK